MSGHSKWAQIKRQKGATDVKRGQLFTKLANVISIAVREGGGITDPESNFRLRLAIDRARAENMPKENIERAIERAKGGGEKEALREVLCEGFGPGGIAVLVEAVTDNKLRTASEIKNVIEKNGGTLASPGAVSYLFEKKGTITISRGDKSFDDVFMIAAEAGAEDLEDLNSEILVYTDAQNLKKVRDYLSKSNISIKDAELIWKPVNFVLISDEDLSRKVLDFVERIEGLDDVHKVYSNFDIPDNLFSKLKSN